MHRLALLAFAVLAACGTLHKRFSLPTETVAAEVGPHLDTKTTMRPKVFVADMVPDEAIAGLAPYCGVSLHFTSSVGEKGCARAAMLELIETMPDAVLVVNRDARYTGTQLIYYTVPYAPNLFAFPVNTHQTTAIGYAMRAMRVRLPFTYATGTGVVMDIPSRDSVTGGLLEGDVLATIDGAPAMPPKDWPTWSFYARMLQRAPGQEVDLTWVRAGVGKMAGRATLMPSAMAHVTAPDSVDTTHMPTAYRGQDKHGAREVWRMHSYTWEPPESETDGWRAGNH